MKARTEDHQRRFAAGPIGRARQPHILEVPQRGTNSAPWRAVSGHTSQIQPRRTGGGHSGPVDLLGQPLCVSVAILPGEPAQEVIRSVPMPPRAVGNVHDAVVSLPGRAGQRQVQGVGGGVTPPVAVGEVHSHIGADP
jgi:hypothetical protein